MSTIQVRPGLRDSQDETPALRCGQCKGEIYRGEPAFEWDGRWLCVDCFKARVGLWLEDAPTQVAAALGFDYEEAG